MSRQRVPPVSAMGSEYVVASYTTRMASLADESEDYRIVGGVAGTTLAAATS